MALIRRGIHLDTHGADDGAAVFRRLAGAARAAEDAGFDAISVPDHVYDPGGPAFPMFEAYTVLGALAAVTSSATLLTLASPVTFREPGLLAKAVTTLDVISGGRAVLSVGVGWDAAEHEAYGIEFPAPGERFDRLAEELAICRALFRDEQATFTGTYYAVRDAYNSPRPVRGSIPVLVAGNGEKRTLALAARYADACNVYGSLADVRRKFDVLARHCESAGRDPAQITRTVAEFAPDLGTLPASARAMAAAGADGMIVACPDDPARIAAIGQILAESFPG